jgi:eukaryotic-like serine/threonine-protein kinase
LKLSQDPAPETELERGSTITVRVSIGPEFYSVPNVAGQPRNEAINRLNQLPVSVNETLEPSTNIPEGNVIRTEPSTQVRNGGTIVVVVSRGDVVRVPDVYQQPVSQAIQQLEAAGLIIGTASPQSCEFIRTQTPASNFDCESFPDQGIVSGTLDWNSWVARGSTINIAYFDAESD